MIYLKQYYIILKKNFLEISIPFWLKVHSSQTWNKHTSWDSDLNLSVGLGIIW